jgi:hypothetical protein
MLWYDTSTEQSTSAVAGTKVHLMNIVGIAGMRGYVRRLQVGPNANAVDVQVRIMLVRTTVLCTAGAAIVPSKALVEGPVAAALPTSLPTGGTLAAVFAAQITFNSRGTGLWFATVEDEAKSFSGATAPNGEIVVDSAQSGSVAVPVDISLGHSE